MLRFATIGSGWITDEYIKGAKDTGLWELTAVYSRTKEKAIEYANKHDAAIAFTNLDDMAKSDNFDAVYIASPNYLHFEHCKLFLEHKKHVICEKPLCAQSEKLKELMAIAKNNGVIFLEAIMYMHLPQRRILEDALASIGDISFAKIDFCQRSSKLDSYLNGEIPNIFNPKMETGALMDLGVYCIYPILHLFGKPDSYSADIKILPTGADSMGVITMSYEKAIVTVTYSKVSESIAGTEFQSADGTVYVDSISRLADISMIKTGGKKEVIYGDDPKYKLMGYEAKDFYYYITEPEKNQENYNQCGKLSLEVSAFMEEIRKNAGIIFDSDKN